MLPIIISALDDPKERDFMAQLYEENERLLFATALKYASSSHDAEEIVQDSLIRLMRKISTLQSLERYTLASYLVSTVRNTAINYMQKQSREHQRNAVYEEEGAEVASSPLSVDELMVIAENRQKLLAAWRELSQTDRTLLEGRYFLGLSDKELAEQLDCKSTSIRMKLTRARRRAMELAVAKEVECR